MTTSGTGRNRAIGLVAGLGIALTATACATDLPTDRAGGDTVNLQFATIDGYTDNAGSFLSALEQVSGGRITVDTTLSYGDGEADAESDLVSSIASGAVDGGWPATRAFAPAGLTGLAAVEAPLAITSHDALVELTTAPAADELIAAATQGGIVALGVMPMELRRPFGYGSEIMGLSDWQGIAFRSFNSPVQTAAISALGATPVTAGANWADRAKEGGLQGGGFSLEGFVLNEWVETSPTSWHVPSNVVLWPKVEVLAMSQKRYDSLTEQQQQWVREAADLAVQDASDHGTVADQEALAHQMCAAGVHFDAVTPNQLKRLHAAVQPVLADLRRDPAESDLMALVDEIRAEHPHADHLDVPTDCEPAAAPTPTPSSLPTQAGAFPEGVYRAEVTTDAIDAAGASNAQGWSGTWTYTFEDGTYALTCRPLDDPGTDCGHAITDSVLEAGNLEVAGDQVRFAFDADLLAAKSGCQLPVSETQPGHCQSVPPYLATWNLSGDTLTFTDSNIKHLTLAPWRQISS